MKLEGRLYRGSSGNYWVRVHGHKEPYVVRLKGTLKKELLYSESKSSARRVISAQKRRATDPVTVGDMVRFDTDLKLIEEVLPRTSELARTASGGREQHVLVANLDTLYCVVAAANPYPNLWVLDRFLVVAENQELQIGIVVNKCDLAEDLDAIRELFTPYEKIGYPIHFVSAAKKIGIDDLRARMKGRVAAFAGNSGVGKSSLLNAIQPGLKLKTGAVGEITGQGRHTTTQAELIPILDDESWLADTPGLRNLDFWEIDEGEVEYGFPEILERVPDCQFGNCTHHNEPGCAILAAVKSGEIDERRWESYVQLYDEAVTGVSAVPVRQ